MIERTAGRILGGLCAIMLAGVTVEAAQAGETAGVPPEVVAEYIHAIIQADRTIYSNPTMSWSGCRISRSLWR